MEKKTVQPEMNREQKKAGGGYKSPNSNFKKKIALLSLIVMLLVVLTYGAWMIKHRIDYAVTDAVFVDTEKIINIGFERVEGRIIRMTKLEGDSIKKGELLAKIDPTNYKVAVTGIQEKLGALRKEKEGKEIALERITKQVALKEGIARYRVRGISKEIQSLREQIASLNATIIQLRRDAKRYRALYKQGAIARRTSEKTDTELIAKERQSDASLKKIGALASQRMAAKKEVRMAITERMTIQESRKGIEGLDKEIRSLESKLKDARLDIGYCNLKSPIDGKIAKKYASEGDVVGSGTPVYALINPKDIFILVLLEETKLKGVKRGCQADIRVDAYPHSRFKGKVEEILPASAAKFALVPRDISAGEFTKVVQRIQVKVKITEGDISKLVVGMGGEIEIKRKKE